MKTVFTFLLVLLGLGASAREGDEMIGTKPPELNVTNWFNSPPRQIADLRGKVVLIRWWTAPGCPYCKASAPALNEFHKNYSGQGLQVIGIYHHKSDEPLDLGKVKATATEYGFKFPIAVDPNWQTLQNWWLKGNERRWTSVSFLLDRNGVIQFIHPGGEYVSGDTAYKELKTKIEELLAK